jgi:hypothetical protein
MSEPAAVVPARTIVPGLVATVVVALAATYLSDHYRAPPVIFALLLGMALNALSSEPRYTPGIDLSARSLLRLSVALLGLRITFGQVGELGWSTAALVIVAVPLTIGFGWLVARAFKLDGRFGVLSGGSHRHDVTRRGLHAQCCHRDHEQPAGGAAKKFERRFTASSGLDNISSQVPHQIVLAAVGHSLPFETAACQAGNTGRFERLRAPYLSLSGLNSI